MVKFFFRQLASMRDAVVGRNQPAQLAWGVAFGVLLGIVPHGNLLAVGLLILLLSLRVNHGMAALAVVGTTLLATRLDPYSHPVGKAILSHEDLSRHLATAWNWPLVPWTDINNTVVLGSFVIGLAALIPIFLLTYPIFHVFAPQGTPIDGGNSGAGAALTSSVTTTRQRQQLAILAESQTAGNMTPAMQPQAIDAAMSGLMVAKLGEDSNQLAAEPQLIETRIDVIRLARRTDAEKASQVEAKDITGQDEPMSEALNYLLRQLHDARERRAA
jgi:uncharacterized protein (TIGR03546 family)